MNHTQQFLFLSTDCKGNLEWTKCSAQMSGKEMISPTAGVSPLRCASMKGYLTHAVRPPQCKRVKDGRFAWIQENSVLRQNRYHLAHLTPVPEDTRMRSWASWCSSVVGPALHNRLLEISSGPFQPRFLCNSIKQVSDLVSVRLEHANSATEVMTR